MSKVYGLQGYLSGKLGNTVFAIVNGEQIGRQYNPQVSNPKTAGQVENRAKLKLLSQLSAAISPVIAIPREGMVSSRNRFTKYNYEYTTYGNSEASIPMADILLTASYTAFPGISVVRTGSAINVQLMERADEGWDKVVYVVLKKGDTGAIAPATSHICDVAGTDGLFADSLPLVLGDISVHAYGIRLNTQESRVRFGNLTAPTAEEVAKIVTSRTYNDSDMALSETRGLFMDSSVNSAETTGFSGVQINGVAYDSTSNSEGVGGTVTGGGFIALNESYTLVATAASGYRFLGWKENLSGGIVSTSNQYTGVATGSTTVYAIFESTAANVVAVAYDRTNATNGGGTVTGAGAYTVGDTATLVATAAEGYEFLGWAIGSPTSTISITSATLNLQVSGNVTVYAIFRVPVVMRTVTLNYATGSNSGMGSMTGAGEVENGATATVRANAASGYDFRGWYSDAAHTTLVSSSNPYSFTASADTVLYAVFAQQTGGNGDEN